MKHFLIISSITVVLLANCLNVQGGLGVKGSGNVTKEQRDISSFSGIEVKGAYVVHLLQGDNESVCVEIDDNLQQYVEIINVGNKLVLSNNNKVDFRNPTKNNVYITLKDIDLLSVSGVCMFVPDNSLSLNNLSVNISGVVSGNLDLHCNELSVNVNGVANIELNGKAVKFDVIKNGVGNINALNLEAGMVSVRNTGVGNLSVNAMQELSMRNAGVGAIKYAGDAKIVSLSSNICGEIKKVSD